MEYRSKSFLNSAIGLLCLCVALNCVGCTGFDILNAPISSVGYDRTVNIPYANASPSNWRAELPWRIALGWSTAT